MPRMFRLFDLVFPIGIPLVLAALAGWGALAAKEPAGKIVSGVTALFFLAAPVVFYLMRYFALRFTYKTKHGVQVRVGKKNKPTSSWVEDCTESIIAHWTKHYGQGAMVRKSLDGSFVIFHDKPELSKFGILVAGYAHGRFAYVTYGDPKYVRLVHQHEQSHGVCRRMGDKSGRLGALHHKLWEKTGLPE